MFFVLAVLCAACTGAGSGAAARRRPAPGTAITVGSFNFPESVLLAYLYADALADKGYPVRVLPDLGTRELVDPALMDGLIQLVPEYTGSALEFVSLGRARHRQRGGDRRGAGHGGTPGAGGAAAARRTATRSWSPRRRPPATGCGRSPTLAWWPGLVFGGPPECPERAYCLPGLKLIYGLRFRQFVALDADGPLTRQALGAGDIGVALLFTTDPAHRGPAPGRAGRQPRPAAGRERRSRAPARHRRPVRPRPAGRARRGVGAPDHCGAGQRWTPQVELGRSPQRRGRG